MPMKKNVNRTTCATSTVVFDDVLGVAYGEFYSSAGSEDCLVVHLAVASSWLFSLRSSNLLFCASARQVPEH